MNGIEPPIILVYIAFTRCYIKTMNINTHIIENFDGILAMGDIHGNKNAFASAIAYAEDNNLFLISLGDLVDYGYENYQSTQMMVDLVSTHKGIMVIGNHDLKFYKWFKQRREGEIRIKVKGGLLTTIAEFDNLSETQQNHWEDMFVNLFKESRYHYILDNAMFVHASARTEMWYTEYLNSRNRSRAIFGQLNKEQKFNKETGFPNRVYTWVNDLYPTDDGYDRFVFFGHDILDNTKPTVINSLPMPTCAGISVDTGSSKGGVLSGYEIVRQNNSWLPSKPINFGK